MSQNKNRKKLKTKVPPTVEDNLLLKKLSGLLALCEFILIPALIFSPSLPIRVAHGEDPSGRDNARSAGVYPPQGGTPDAPERSSVWGRQGAALQEHMISSVTSGEVQIVAVPESVLEPKEVIKVTVTAYSSTTDQTDQTPFHTANGKDVGDGIVAANFLPLGTQLRIPKVFGDQIFTVEDRMHERFDRHLDIWMPTREAAQQFGIRQLTVEIL